jgi:hypothetical protein
MFPFTRISFLCCCFAWTSGRALSLALSAAPRIECRDYSRCDRYISSPSPPAQLSPLRDETSICIIIQGRIFTRRPRNTGERAGVVIHSNHSLSRLSSSKSGSFPRRLRNVRHRIRTLASRNHWKSGTLSDYFTQGEISLGIFP